jgi:lipoprotein-anchoring transpeptidase ErfK/SrfK
VEGKDLVKIGQLCNLSWRSSQVAVICLTFIVGTLSEIPPLRADELESHLLPAITPATTPANTPVTQITRLEIDLSDRRLTLYQGNDLVKSYPIAVGRRDWQTPVGAFQVVQMIRNPAWMNPLTRAVIPGGNPNNPLGRYWIGFWTDGQNWVGMHGTPNPESIGQAASHGCIRLYNRDIQELFTQVSVGTPVTVVP